MRIYAFRGNNDEMWSEAIYNSLIKDSEARFGWSYYSNIDDDLDNIDLIRLREKIRNNDPLSSDEQNCYQPFLLDIKVGDYIVFINIPSYGDCTLAQVNQEYYYKKHTDIQYEWGYDGNHCLGIDKTTLHTFDRNCAKVHPELRRRLKLQGRYWQIYVQKEFDMLLECLKNNTELIPDNTRLGFLKKDLSEIWQQITDKISSTHEGKKLEPLVVDIFKHIPNVKEVYVNNSCWRSDNGADVIVNFYAGLEDFTELNQEKKLVIQVKSYQGDHSNLNAVNDIKKAIDYYKADYGMIFTTGNETDELKRAIELASEELQKNIALCAGEDVAKFFLKYCIEDVIK